MQNVFVGLSGGVDSAVSAALLKQRGYHVTGVFIKIWQPEFFECTWEKDRIDAMRVAAALDIPFRELDLSSDYRQSVVQEMTSGYAAGYTPNPDVACNERIKFGAFAQWALENGADTVATGHYARIEHVDSEYRLLRGIDANKDQSYFLYRMSRAVLEKTMFPVGELTKTEVRALAKKIELPVASKHDSQGLCFVGDVSMRDFLRRFIPVEEGDVLDAHGTPIGKHDGASLYTIGQRHGFTVADSRVPHYVAGVHVADNTLVVSRDKADCARTFAAIREAHWLTDLQFPLDAQAQTRYREKTVAVSVSGEKVTFREPHILSPGQDIVLFDGERVLGGARLA